MGFSGYFEEKPLKKKLANYAICPLISSRFKGAFVFDTRILFNLQNNNNI